ncbi:hypothetical protein SKAU_G00253580 [Synaphobranchus kaupii]|uniref:Uncharacterized protein n=1 Tax=Synaphobranchus kaupii TaxID=118154 RepID=A0A9Q1IRV0_SYNKA|nr:hypothetical protein SKAU_G00253580 [Synaphobranchus kaupii]
MEAFHSAHFNCVLAADWLPALGADVRRPTGRFHSRQPRHIFLHAKQEVGTTATRQPRFTLSLRGYGSHLSQIPSLSEVPAPAGLCLLSPSNPSPKLSQHRLSCRKINQFLMLPRYLGWRLFLYCVRGRGRASSRGRTGDEASPLQDTAVGVATARRDKSPWNRPLRLPLHKRKPFSFCTSKGKVGGVWSLLSALLLDLLSALLLDLLSALLLDRFTHFFHFTGWLAGGLLCLRCNRQTSRGSRSGIRHVSPCHPRTQALSRELVSDSLAVKL